MFFQSFKQPAIACIQAGAGGQRQQSKGANTHTASLVRAAESPVLNPTPFFPAAARWGWRRMTKACSTLADTRGTETYNTGGLVAAKKNRSPRERQREGDTVREREKRREQTTPP